MHEYKVSARYAKALIEIGSSEGLADEFYEDFKTVQNTLDTSQDLKTLTRSPVIQPWKKKKCYIEVFEGKVNHFTLDFILLLTKKGRDNLLPSIIYQYETQYNKLNKKLPVDIFTSEEMPEEIKSKVINKLTEWSGMTIIPNFVIDPSLKGGIKVRVDDWVYDASLKAQLENLYESLAGTAN